MRTVQIRVHQTVEEHFDIEIPDGLDDTAHSQAIEDAIEDYEGPRTFDGVTHQYLAVLS